MKNLTPDDTTVRKLVARVIKDGRMNRFEACNFVASMFEHESGLTVMMRFNNHASEWEQI